MPIPAYPKAPPALVILESPYGSMDTAVVAENIAYLQRCIRHAVLVCNESPYASHQMLTAALDDTSPEERKVGIEAGFAWRAAAHRSVVYLDRGISKGMVLGIIDSLKRGCRVVLRAFGPVAPETTDKLRELLGNTFTIEDARD